MLNTQEAQELIKKMYADKENVIIGGYAFTALHVYLHFFDSTVFTDYITEAYSLYEQIVAKVNETPDSDDITSVTLESIRFHPNGDPSIGQYFDEIWHNSFIFTLINFGIDLRGCSRLHDNKFSIRFYIQPEARNKVTLDVLAETYLNRMVNNYKNIVDPRC